MLFASALNAIRLFLYIFAYLLTSLANAVIILFTWPVFATLLGIFVLKEKVTKRTAFLITMAFLGIIFMYLNKEFSFGDGDFLGMAAMLGSAILFAVMMVIFKRELENYSNTETIFYQNLVGAVIALPFLFVNVPFPTIAQLGLSTIYGLVIGIFSFSSPH
jgi:drug/metabolite transporter (DMT)-like permease